MVQLLPLLTIASAILSASAAPRHGGRHPKGPKGPGKGKPAPPAAPPMGGMNTSASSPKAVYFQTNKAPNSIVAIPVAADGTLSGGVLTSTGGNGGNTVNADTGVPNAPDALGSQGSVVVNGNFLFTTNAADNTITMMTIDPANPTCLMAVGAPGQVDGDFPTSIAVSAALGTVCAAMTGARAGISCATFSAAGMSAFDTLRPFNLGQSNPPTGPLNGIGDTFFLEDSSMLITTVKGDPTANGTLPGFISMFPASAAGGVSTQGTQVTPNGTAVLFGATQIPGTNNLFVSDASFGALTVSLDDATTPLTKTPIADQAATCWTKVSGGTGFVSDVAVNHLDAIDLATGAITQEFNATNGNLGMIDFALVGTKIFALAPGNNKAVGCNVAVFDISYGIAEVQNFAAPAGTDANAQGLAVLL